jgi:uncharacterized membrane protein (UPF0136 family)
MDLETIWYECSPYLYLAGGVATILKSDSRVGLVSGVLLIAAAATILRLRYVHRKDRKRDPGGW